MKKRILILTLLSCTLLFLSACGEDKKETGDEEEITLEFGAQQNLDPQIASEIVKGLIEEETEHSVNIKKDIQASPQIIGSMEQKELDAALFFSSEVYHDYFDEDEYEFTTEREKTLKQAQELFDEHYDFKWYDSIGFSNDYALAVDEEFAEEHDIKTFSDLEPFSDDQIIGADASWVERDNDGYDGFSEEYFEFKEVKAMETSIMFEAIEKGDIDVALAYAVEPRIKKSDLSVLEDDKEFFPPYTASIVVRENILENYPEIDNVLSRLVGEIDEEDMTDLMYDVRFEDKSQEETAKKWLEENDYLKDKE